MINNINICYVFAYVVWLLKMGSYECLQGTGFVYETMLRPFMVRHETDIETRLKQFRDRAWDVAIYYWQNSTELGQTKIFEIFQYLLSSKPSTTKPTPSQVSIIKC